MDMIGQFLGFSPGIIQTLGDGGCHVRAGTYVLREADYFLFSFIVCCVIVYILQKIFPAESVLQSVFTVILTVCGAKAL